MKRAALLTIGLLSTLIFVAVACGGGATATPLPKPRATNTPAPTSVAEPTTPPAAATEAPAATPVGPVERLEISVNGDALEFDKNSLSVGAGSQVVLKFSNVSAINQHNWVLVRAGTGKAVSERGALHPTTDWLEPGDPDVIANTKLLATAATGEVSFAAPSAGTYQFVCTFPGHNATMTGDFQVAG